MSRILSYIVSPKIQTRHLQIYIQILYFGMIRQSTGEDWENAKVSLSTALPSVGGSPPSLEPLILSPLEYHLAMWAASEKPM